MHPAPHRRAAMRPSLVLIAAASVLTMTSGWDGATVLVAADKAPAAQPSQEEMARDPLKFLDVARKTYKWDEPAEPAHIIGPIHFVGTQGLSSFLITTSA